MITSSYIVTRLVCPPTLEWIWQINRNRMNSNTVFKMWEKNCKMNWKTNLCTNDLLPRAVIWWCTSDLLVSSAGCDISRPSRFRIDKYLHGATFIIEQIHTHKVYMQNTEQLYCAADDETRLHVTKTAKHQSWIFCRNKVHYWKREHS